MGRLRSSLASSWVFSEEEEEEGQLSHTLSRLARFVCQTVTLRGGAPPPCDELALRSDPKVSCSLRLGTGWLGSAV